MRKGEEPIANGPPKFGFTFVPQIIIECTKCTIEIQCVGVGAEDEATDTWNTRYQPTDCYKCGNHKKDGNNAHYCDLTGKKIEPKESKDECLNFFS